MSRNDWVFIASQAAVCFACILLLLFTLVIVDYVAPEAVREKKITICQCKGLNL